MCVCGSTAVAGYLDGCGAYTCPPHVKTNDEHTPNAYELLAYCNELVKFFDAWWVDECAKAEELGCGYIVLKQPLQTFVLPFLNKKLNPSHIFVPRPLDEIEKTRNRRKWTQFTALQDRKWCILIPTSFLSPTAVHLCQLHLITSEMMVNFVVRPLILSS